MLFPDDHCATAFRGKVINPVPANKQPPAHQINDSNQLLVTEKNSTIEREMGFTRDDFFNRLPRAFTGYNYVTDRNGITITMPGGNIQVLIGEQGERKLSENVIFPILPVTIHFNNIDTETRKVFLHRFNLSYMKGLG